MAVRHIEIKPFSWVHPQLAIISRCDLDIYMGEENVVVLASQLGYTENAGINVTDGAVLIALTVMNKYGFLPDRLIWIEHYPSGTPGDRINRKQPTSGYGLPVATGNCALTGVIKSKLLLCRHSQLSLIHHRLPIKYNQ